MKSIFVAQSADIVGKVYCDSVKEKLYTEFGMVDDRVYGKKEIIADKESFSDTEYVFSTWSMPFFTEEEIKVYFPKLKAVLYAAGSVQGFARPFLANNVQVFSGWAANAIPVAETAVSHILLANKGYHMSAFYCSKGAEYRKKAEEYVQKNRGNYGCKVGILGVGMVGTEVCKLLKHHRLTVLAFDPFCSEEKAKELGITLTSLETIFSECEVISNHLANNAQTKNMINYDLLKLMHDNATFINTGRGAQVVEADLARVLKEKPHSCAVLDVTDPEPPKEDCPFFEMDNVILTPHLAGSQRDEWWRMAEYMFEEAMAVEKGEPTRYSVTVKMLETMA